MEVENKEVNNANTLQEEIEQEELTYIRFLNELRNFKEMKHTHLEMMRELETTEISKAESDQQEIAL